MSLATSREQFAANQGQFQVRYVGQDALPSLIGDRPARRAISVTLEPYFINNGKIVTSLVGTPIEITVYKAGDKYLAARSNEFG